jgi:hypothetical protein
VPLLLWLLEMLLLNVVSFLSAMVYDLSCASQA